MEFALSNTEARKLFRPHSRAMKCRQLIYAKANTTDAPVAVADLVRDHPEFRSAEIYQAARSLVTHGILTREDISWGAVVKGQEKTHYRCAVKAVAPFSAGNSRKW